MYAVNEKFLTAMHSYILQPLLRGTVGGVPFSHEDILADSFRCCGQCVTVNDVKVGGVFVGEIQFTLLRSVANTRGDWYGKKILCEYGLMVEGEPVFIPCPSYEYTINEATWTENGLKIVAYDNMILLDKAVNVPQSTGSAWDWLQFVKDGAGVALGNTELEVAAMPNGQAVLGISNTSKLETYRDLVSYLAAALGGYATINRAGALVIKQFGSSVVDVIDAESRFSGCSFSDYVTKYTGLSVVNDAEATVEVVHKNPDDGLTMKLGSNPFFQLGVDATKKAMMNAVLDSIQAFAYVPFKATLLGCCAYDLGDLIRFTDGIAGDSVGCIMAYDFGLSSYAVSGYGSNPALENAQSKSDKNIVGLSKQQASEQLAVTTLSNVSQVGIGTEWTRIGSASFAVSKSQTVLFHGVSKHDLGMAGHVKYKYLLDGEPVDFEHDASAPLGIDTTTLFLPFLVDAGVLHRFEVFVMSEDATGVVERLNMQGAIIGAGIIGADWDGTISVEDVFRVSLVGGLSIPFTDAVEPSVVLFNPLAAGVMDNFALELDGGLKIDFTDGVRVVTSIPEYGAASEDGVQMFTESGDYLVIE